MEANLVTRRGALVFSAAIRNQPAWLLLGESTALTLTIGVIDRATGWDLSLSLLYLLPILFIATTCGKAPGIILSMISGATWWWANRGGHPYSTEWGYLSATLNRTGYFAFVAIGGAALKTAHDSWRGRVEALERTRELENAIVQIAENEQRRIGQDLHDGLCQTLSAIGLVAAELKESLHSKGLPETDVAREVEQLIQESSVEARDIARGIFPVQIGEFGLVAALEELMARTRRLQKVAVDFSADQDVDLFDPTVAMHVYRIVQEALTNALKHGRAKNIRVRICYSEGRIDLSVADDGVGLPPNPRSSLGMGMRTMEYRARLIDAALEAGNRSSGGAIITCQSRTFGAPPTLERKAAG